tara:strand:- start:1403 stop:1879 length:477 start_codon:yes stop_codon:yes gene_type:complete
MNKDNNNIHGVLISISGFGVLIKGKSGIGKSECAVELLNKGAQLVADDLVLLKKIENKLLGYAPENIKNLIEIRGIGILNVKNIFGYLSALDESEIKLIVNLVDFNKENKYDRLGYDTKEEEISGIKIPSIEIPVSPGRNISTLIEIAVKKLNFEGRL